MSFDLFVFEKREEIKNFFGCICISGGVHRI